MSDQMPNAQPQFLTVGEGEAARDIAIIVRSAQAGGDAPALVWLSGYRSDMSGTKAVELDGLAAELGLACIRLDYSGHGLSGGSFSDGTISRWLEEALAVIRHVSPERVILVGSSMGGWIALRLAQELARQGGPKLVGMVLIAPAPDFTSELIEPNLKAKERKSLAERGYFEERSQYSPEPNIYTKALIEDGHENRVLDGIIETGCPVHILQGMKDADVPHAHAMKLVEHLPADDVVLTFIRDGDHRLSRPGDIALLLSAVKGILASSADRKMPA
ncbi:2-hydroxymuconic semialdehyde hydrolase [Rhizobium leguminosarum bv. trifolii CB782]|uniref:Palmitoyl-protein thioesterase ABHD10, mitochondrial n=1 Tax=Rhizobium hidalgonense TaxID=1538159 RepID=A0A2A6KH51_9HYPH|nr:alpha/beta hydrolase [Rhizobium hidalgonense]AHG47727.1 2-hydroxymuconic semialdehyde hydrolase [Rhizobium leguminosarum bv. trifolii CB782]EJC74666.1 putative hydrolase or acyltransferase of alpha/beta superfamily [Rhizobium leguminosarum bv. trifolii WSM2012]MDR9774301.1 alpha/beta hydrolase [Rhizobium hidalgonense]MDR9804423.1 alpha/beta hydrolase [Rhizobium hidalgonense]MDR9811937.1 alpha/beta hydrolase [Rhizobium hidalgonense]